MKSPLFVLSTITLFAASSCTPALTSSSSTGDLTSTYVESSASTDSATSESTAPSSSEVPAIDGYNLYWHDEFDGTALNTDDWSYMIGDGSQYGIAGWGNNEAEYYTRDNVAVNNGYLTITAKKESVGGKSYTSGRLRTADKVNTCYGRIEASISLPSYQGMWPAFWMLPESDSPYGYWASSGEIDIMEAKGRINTATSGALHFGNQGQSTYISNGQTFNFSTIDSFHTYAIEWEENEIRWYVDDVEFLSVTSDQWWSEKAPDSPTAPFDTNFHILLNLAVGGNFDGGLLPPENFTAADMVVDYVRIYHKR